MDTTDEKENISKAKDTATMEEEVENDPEFEGNTTTSEADANESSDKLLTMEKLTEGFTAELLPQLQELREKTKELTKNQNVLIETMQQENRKFLENKEIEDFAKMISVVQSYYKKLRNIKTEMDQLEERMAKLKKRSLRLKERRQKRDMDEAQKREHELALERELTAKPAT